MPNPQQCLDMCYHTWYNISKLRWTKPLAIGARIVDWSQVIAFIVLMVLFAFMLWMGYQIGYVSGSMDTSKSWDKSIRERVLHDANDTRA